MRLFLDTDVLIDYFARREPFFATWTQLRCAQMLGDVELWASAKSFTDVFYVLSKACPSEAIQAAFVSSLDFLNVCSIDGEDVRLAASRRWEDFEDCLIDVAAQNVGADYLITRDAAGFSRAKTPTLSPAAFFEWLRDERHVEYEELDVGGEVWETSVQTHEGTDAAD